MEDDPPSNDLSDGVAPQPAVDSGDERRQSIRSAAESTAEVVGSSNGEGSVPIRQSPQSDGGGERRLAAWEENLSAAEEERPQVDEIDENACSLQKVGKVPVFEPAVAVEEVMQEIVKGKCFGIDEKLDWERLELAEGGEKVSSSKEEVEEKVPILEHAVVVDEVMQENFEQKILDVDEPNPFEQLGVERAQLAEGDEKISSLGEVEEQKDLLLEHSVADEVMQENTEEKLSEVAGPQPADELNVERPELAEGDEKDPSLQEALVEKDEKEGLVEKEGEEKVLETDEVMQENIGEKLLDFDGPHPVVLLNEEMPQSTNNDEKVLSLQEDAFAKEDEVTVSKLSVPAAVDDVIMQENVDQKLSEEQLNEERPESSGKGRQVSSSQQGLVEDDDKVSSSQEASADKDEKVSALQEESSEKEGEESEKEKEESDEKEEAEEMDMDEGGPAMAAGKRMGSKRKHGRPKVVQGRRARVPSKPKEDEELCFICFDGGDLVVCDHRGCPKVYHPSCVNRDEAYFKAKGQWSCGWHICSNCQKSARYMCYTCTYSVCKRCIKEADFVCVRENKGFCETCMKTVMMIEMNKHSDGTTDVVDFDDKTSWMYLFKDYWVDLKAKLSLTMEELAAARNILKETNRVSGSEKPSVRNRAVQGKEEHLEKPGNRSDDQGGISSSSSRCYKESTSSSKKVKKRSRNTTNKECMVKARVKQASISEDSEWASKELLELVAHMKDGDRSVLPQFDVQNLLLEYIKQNNLRDPHRKSQIICDSMLLSLFGKSRVGHLEMLKLLEPHFLIKEASPLATDENQDGVVDPDPSQTDAEGNSDTSTKVISDIRRKSRKKIEEKGPTSLLDYAAIDVHNVSLMYLRRNLMEDFLDDVDMFNENVVGSFVRIRISGSASNKDMYRLVQVVGTGKAAEMYKTGKKTTDITLEVLNLSRREVITIDLISNQDFTEEECKRLRQSVKCGFIDRLRVAEVQEKARSLHAARVNDWIESEKLRLGHLRDRASEKGRKKEHRECVVKLQLLSTSEERIRRLDEVPEVHVDPNMDPDCDSTEEEDDQNAKRQDSNKVPKYSLKDRDEFSAGKRNSATRKNPHAAWDTNRNTPKTGGVHDVVLHAVPADRTDGFRNQGNGPLSSPRSPKAETNATCMNTGVLKNAQLVMGPGQSCGVLPETALKPLSASVVSSNTSETEKMWHYQDPAGKIQGPFAMTQLRKWNASNFFPANLRIWRTSEKQEDSILLTDALSEKFHKDLQHKESQHSNSTLPTNAAAIVDYSVNNMGDGVRVNNFPLTAASLPATGNYNLAKSDSWAAQPSSSSTTNMVKVGPMDRRPVTSSTGWESSSRNSNAWSGESQPCNSPRSMTPSSRYSSQQPSFQGRDGRGENNGRWNGGRGRQNTWNSNSRQNNWNSNRPRRFQPNDRGYERQHPYQNSSSRQQFPGEHWKVQPANNSSNQLGRSPFNPPVHAPQPNNIDWAGLQGALNKILPSASSGQPMNSSPSAIPRGNEVQQTPFNLTSLTMNSVGGLASNSVPNVNPAKTQEHVGVLSNFQPQSMPAESAALVTSGHNAVHSVSSTPPNSEQASVGVLNSGSSQPASQLNETGDLSVPLNEVVANKKCPEAHDVSASDNKTVNDTVVGPASVAPDALGSSNLPDASVSVQRLEASSSRAQSKSQCWAPASAQQQGPNNVSVNPSQPLNMGWGMVQHTPNPGTGTAQEIGSVVHPATPGAANMGWGMLAHGLMNMTWGTTANLNMGWGPQAQATMNPNLGWAIPAQGNANANLAWGAQAQVNPNAGWVMPMQVNPALNPGWVATGIGNTNPNPSLGAPTEGNANQNATWVTPIQGGGQGCTSSAVNQNVSGGQSNSQGCTSSAVNQNVSGGQTNSQGCTSSVVNQNVSGGQTNSSSEGGSSQLPPRGGQTNSSGEGGSAEFANSMRAGTARKERRAIISIHDQMQR